MQAPQPRPQAKARNPEAALRAAIVTALCKALGMDRTEFRNAFARPHANRVGQGAVIHATIALPTLLVACSGGGDSMALATLLHRMQLRFAVAHVNYALRGTESEADEQLVRDWCTSTNVGLYIGRVSDHEALQNGNMHANARLLRYGFFEELCQKHSFAALLTAHHAQDQAETVLQRLARGSGIRGLQAIKKSTYLEAGTLLIRPLLSVYPGQMLRYLAFLEVPYRTDPSNLSIKYQRGRLRTLLFGPLAQEAGSITQTLARLSDEAAEMEEVLSYALNIWIETYKLPALDRFVGAAMPEIRIPRQALVQLGASLLLRRYLEPLGLQDYAERLAQPVTPDTLPMARFAHNGYVCNRTPTGISIQYDLHTQRPAPRSETRLNAGPLAPNP